VTLCPSPGADAAATASGFLRFWRASVQKEAAVKAPFISSDGTTSLDSKYIDLNFDGLPRGRFYSRVGGFLDSVEGFGGNKLPRFRVWDSKLGQHTGIIACSHMGWYLELKKGRFGIGCGAANSSTVYTPSSSQ
jgi:hypothetical protein